MKTVKELRPSVWNKYGHLKYWAANSSEVKTALNKGLKIVWAKSYGDAVNKYMRGIY